jgi:hypothetical protein
VTELRANIADYRSWRRAYDDSNYRPGCVIQISDADPTTATTVGFHLGSSPFVYTGSSHIWVFGSGSVVIGK